MKSPRSFITRLILAVTLLIAAFPLGFLFIPGLNSKSKPTQLVVHRGMRFSDVLDKLQASGVIRERWQPELIARMVPKFRTIKAGRYTIPPNTSNFGLLWYLRTHPLDEVRVTLPEGIDRRKMARILSRKLDFDSTQFMAATENPRLLAKYGIRASHAEGYLLPGTYDFAWGSSPDEAASFLIRQFKKLYTTERQQRAAALGFNEHSLLTLASIVEAETPLDKEKPTVASVYLHRLRIGMRLQADPTVQYALGGTTRRLYYKDLAIASPYNTYRNKGLPPGPICNPGKASIIAVLNAPQSGYLYFVATGTGGHYFGASLQEHHANVQKYKQVRSSNE